MGVSDCVMIDSLRNLLEDSIRNVSGPLGRLLRRAYYSRTLASCGSRLSIEPGVYIVNPQYIHVGDVVWIDRGVILVAGPAGVRERTSHRHNQVGAAERGTLRIGSFTHLGIRTIVQAHGGVDIDDGFTSSANVAIYSLSNDPYRCRMGTIGTDSDPSYYREHSVTIGRNVWIGIGGVVLGGLIGADSFIKPYSVVTEDIPANSVACGFPAVKVATRFESAANSASVSASV